MAGADDKKVIPEGAAAFFKGLMEQLDVKPKEETVEPLQIVTKAIDQHPLTKAFAELQALFVDGDDKHEAGRFTKAMSDTIERVDTHAQVLEKVLDRVGAIEKFLTVRKSAGGDEEPDVDGKPVDAAAMRKSAFKSSIKTLLQAPPGTQKLILR